MNKTVENDFLGFPKVKYNNNNYNNNSSFISTADNPQLIQQAVTQDSTDTIEHKEPAIIQPNITTRISMGGRQLQVSAKVDHNAVN